MSQFHHSTPMWAGLSNEPDDNFWPSFVDIMMVITMIFLLVTVATILTNTQLLTELRERILTEQAAQKQAMLATNEVKLKSLANQTLEERLDNLQTYTKSLEINLLKSQAQNETAKELVQQQLINLNESNETNNSLQNQLLLYEELDNEKSLLVNELAKTRDNLQEQVTAKDKENQNLTDKLEKIQLAVTDGQTKFKTLNSEFKVLDKKYQKLIRPARSSKGKQVAIVVIRKSGILLQKPKDSGRFAISKTNLDAALSALKAKYGKELYIKIVIPKDSGLSYNEAWLFTKDILSKYDYYHQYPRVPVKTPQ